MGVVFSFDTARKKNHFSTIPSFLAYFSTELHC